MLTQRQNREAAPKTAAPAVDPSSSGVTQPRGNAFAAARLAGAPEAARDPASTAPQPSLLGAMMAGQFPETGAQSMGGGADLFEDFSLAALKSVDDERDETVHSDEGDVTVQNAGRKFEVTQIVEAVAQARVLVRGALAMLPALSDAAARAAFEKHFHTTDPEAVARVASDLGKLQAALGKSLTFEVEADGEGYEGYVYRFWSDIHLGASFFQQIDVDEQAATIIHECSHKFCGTDDEAYSWTPDYKGLSADDALDNADSYAAFCKALA